MVVETNVPKVSKVECCEVVSKKLHTQEFTVLKYEQVSFDERHGYLGDHSILNIEVKRGDRVESLKFFAKSLPKEQSQRSFLEEINGVFKEKQFFTRYLPLLKQHSIDLLDDAVPTCYLSTDETFIFEDLNSRGYQTLSSREPLKMDCVKAALITFAKLHASGLILEETRSFRLVEDFGEELKETFYLGTGQSEAGMQAARTGIRALIDLTHREDMEMSRELFTLKAMEGCELQKAATTPSARFRNTICHADPWTKNFLFKFEGGRAVNCMAVDFQTYRYGPPAQDVMAFVHLATDRALRDRHLDELLDFYYRELDAHVEKFGFKGVVSREEFFESCRYFKRFALTQTMTHFPVVILSEEIAAEMFADAEYAKLVLFEDKYEFVKMVCQKDPVFRERVFELIDEVREFYQKQLLIS